jgi:hypothetical protein
MFLVLLVVLAGRSGEVLLQVKHAADQGARAASISAISRQTVEGRDAALNDLAVTGVSCNNPRVSVEPQQIGPTRFVKVVVECEVNHKGLDLLGVGAKIVRAESLEVLDTYRAG